MRFLLISVSLLLLNYRCGTITAATPLELTEDEAHNSTLAAYFCDDELLKNIAHQMELLQEANLNLKLEITAQKTELLDQTKNLGERMELEMSSLSRDIIRENRRLLQISPNVAFEKTEQKPIKKHLPASCAEAISQSDEEMSGIYQIHLPDSGLKPFFVYCLIDPDNGPAWTIFQRREGNTTNFYRNWNEYKLGFGNLHSDFFIGLDKLHAITNAELSELWIELGDYESEKRSAKYNSFAIGNEDEKYAMNILGEYSGDAGDSLQFNQGMKFTTKDQDNDINPDNNDATVYTGAWWFSDKSCSSNLNGRYLGGKIAYEQRGEGVNWNGWRGWEYSLKYSHMAIRPKQ